MKEPSVVPNASPSALGAHLNFVCNQGILNMKPKIIEKKLVLKKRTIIDLNDKELDKAMGGITGDPCQTIQKTVCWTECETDCPFCPTVRCM
jgi:hypothetical protein